MHQHEQQQLHQQLNDQYQKQHQFQSNSRSPQIQQHTRQKKAAIAIPTSLKQANVSPGNVT